MDRQRGFGQVVLALATTIGLAACNSNQGLAKEPPQCKAYKGETETVNQMCVIMNEDPVDPEVTPVVWKGQKIGFCCSGCKPDWEKLTDAEKDAAVAKAVNLPASKQ